jgi:SAM-dependent methyltransferase
MNAPFIFWLAIKNALRPFRRLISGYLYRRHAHFDRKLGICTIGGTTLDEPGLSPDRLVRHEAAPITFFCSILARLHLDYSTTVFVDLGCGKGRTLILASRYLFHSIVGVEPSEALYRVAIANVQRYRSEHPGTSEISVVCNPLDSFENHGCKSAAHLLIYMHNPRMVSADLRELAQLAARGMLITIIYLNPDYEEILANASWLKEMRRGEALDESGGFTPYVVCCSLPQSWKPAIETLVFRFGPWTLASRSFASLSNMTNPLAAESRPLKTPPIFQPTTYQQMPDDGTIRRTLSFDRNAIRYVSYRGKRHFIDLLQEPFDNYLAKFSAKTRNTLQRKTRHFAKQSGGRADFRIYSSPEEMIEFRRQALAVSLLSYQREIGFGFPETAEFETNLIENAANGRVCGFVLMKENKPAAYVFCWINQDIVTYSYCGYDPEFARFSPGTVLLFLIIRWLFEQKKYRLFDLGNDSWEYKTMFSTSSVKYLKVIWFPKTASNVVLIIVHLSVLRAWTLAAWAKTTGALWAHKARTAVRPFIPLHRTAG